MVDRGHLAPDALIQVVTADYPGYARAMNQLIGLCLAAGADAVMCSNDDMIPRDGMSAAEVGRWWKDEFGESTFGVCQPAGDDYGNINGSAICPIVGAEYARRINQGRGAYWPEYHALYSDTELHDVAKRLGVYRTDHTRVVFHEHWTRGFGDTVPKEKRERQQSNANADKRLYVNRRIDSFPGHEPLR